MGFVLAKSPRRLVKYYHCCLCVLPLPAQTESMSWLMQSCLEILVGHDQERIKCMIVQSAVSGSVDFNNEGREESIHAKLVHAQESTPVLLLMGAEAVERVSKCRNVEAVPDKNSLPVNGDDSRSDAKDWGE
jgi:hypothetical protein